MKEKSRAELNNNFGNLRPPKGVVYDGQIGVDPEGFAIFQTPAHGRSALINDIDVKRLRGVNTPNDFVDAYLGKPDQEDQDNTAQQRAAYKIHLANSLGLDSTGAEFPDAANGKIADALSAFETGNSSYASDPNQETGQPSQGVEEQPSPPLTLDQKNDLYAKKAAKIAGGKDTYSPDQYTNFIGAGVGGMLGAAGAGSDFVRDLTNRVFAKGQASVPPSSAEGTANAVNGAKKPSGLVAYGDSQLKRRIPLPDVQKIAGIPIETNSNFQDAIKVISKGEKVLPTPDLGGEPGKIIKTFDPRAVTYKPFDLSEFPTVSEHEANLARQAEEEANAARNAALKARGPLVKISDYLNSKPALRGLVDGASSVGKTIGQIPGVGFAAKTGFGALSGWNAANDSRQALHDFDKGNYGSALVNGLSGVGGVLGMVPTPVTRGAGFAMQYPNLIKNIYNTVHDEDVGGKLYDYLHK